MQRNYRLLNVRNGLSRKRAMNLMRTLGETGFCVRKCQTCFRRRQTLRAYVLSPSKEFGVIVENI